MHGARILRLALTYTAGFLLLAGLAVTTFAAGTSGAWPAAPTGVHAPTEESAGMAASALLEDYAKDAQAADARYRGTWVRVTGVVSDVRRDLAGTLYVKVGTGHTFELPQVQCFFTREPLASQLPAPGTRLTVRGLVSGQVANVLLKECSLVPEALLPTADTARH